MTGGAGLIGSHIVDQYIASGHEVAIVDNLWHEGGGKEANVNPQARFFLTVITDEEALARVFFEIRPEVVNHQAAQHSVAISTKDPRLDARVNVLASAHLRSLLLHQVQPVAPLTFNLSMSKHLNDLNRPMASQK
jgi:UDP-glucose 4-epimerase